MRVCVRVCVRIRLKSNVTIMSNETLFWGFIDDLKTLGDDVKAQVLFGGCRWGEPSPIPDVVERLSKLDYKEIENTSRTLICNDMMKGLLRKKVRLIWNYHLECNQDLAYSDNDKVQLYARWLNRLILICGELEMADIIPLSKQDDSDKETISEGIDVKQIPEKIISLFLPTRKENGILDKSSRVLAKEYLDSVRGCSLSVCATVYNDEYGAKGKAVTGKGWGKKKGVLYDFLLEHNGATKNIEKRTFGNYLN